MNNFKNKKNISLLILIIILCLFIFFIYFINNKVRVYKTDVLVDYNKLAELENERDIFNTYNKILIKGSDESIKIKKYILSNDRKEVLNFINQLEDYTKKVGLIENNNSPIISLSPRDNSTIQKYNANDLVINIRVTGSKNKVEDFINILNNLPMISYIEKIDIKFDDINNKNTANIILVIYQKNEIK